MFKFYSIVFVNKLGKEMETIAIGTHTQCNDWAIKEASSYGLTYSIVHVSSYDFTGTVKNLANY